jgi:acetate kinase
MFVNKIVNYISMYNTELNKADVICFTAGIGENSIKTREQIINKLEALGVKLDIEKNNIRGEEQLISTADSLIKCYVIPTDEELMIAEETYNLIK